MSPDDLHEAEQRARAHAKAEEQLLGALEKRKNDSLNTIVQRGVLARQKRLGHDEILIRSYPPQVYTVPASVKKLLSASAVTEMEDLLAIVKAGNDDMVGVPLAVACARLDGDELVQDLHQRLRLWADRYVESRLNALTTARWGRQELPEELLPRLERNDRCYCGSGKKYKACHLSMDEQRSLADTDPLADFKAISLGIFPLLERVLDPTGTVHGVFLNDFGAYVFWAAYHATWADRVSLHGGTELRPNQISIDLPKTCHAECMRFLEIHQWGHSDGLSRVYRVMRRAGLPATTGEDRARKELRAFASDIVEMRPFLIELDEDVNTIVEIAPGIFASWSWGGGQTLGHVPIAESREELVQQNKEHGFYTRLQARYDGSLVSDATPWRDGEAFGERDAAALNVSLLRPLHDRLYELYGQRVNLEDAHRKAQELAESTDLTDELVAVTCQVDAIGEAEKLPVEVAPEEPRPRLPTMRLQRLLALLAVLGCEISSGKGSEVKLYRPGGKVMVLGRHTANREVPSMLVRRVLERLGISFREWLTVLKG